MEAISMYISGGMNKEDVIQTHTHTHTHTHNGILFSYKNEQNCAKCRDMDVSRCYT